MLTDICGNEDFKNRLLAALSSGRLSHSVLLVGEDGTGTGYAARCLAADYLYPEGGNEAQCVMRGESPECILISGEGISGDIKIDTVRQMRREIYNTALSALGRCVIIKANKLNLASANSLLKVLEEPPENLLFILTAPSEAAVLPTIRSRCMIYTISPVSSLECERFLLNNGADQPKATELTAVFKGKIGICMRVLASEAEATLYEMAKTIHSATIAADELTLASTFAPYEKDRLTAIKLLSYTRAIFSANLDKGSQQSAVALSVLFDAILQLSRNASAKLVFTSLAAQMCE